MSESIRHVAKRTLKGCKLTGRLLSHECAHTFDAALQCLVSRLAASWSSPVSRRPPSYWQCDTLTHYYILTYVYARSIVPAWFHRWTLLGCQTETGQRDIMDVNALTVIQVQSRGKKT